MKFQRSAAGRLFGTLLAGMAAAFLSAGADAQELNALVWCDHSGFCPTGGIDQRNAADYLALANVLCVGGSWVAPPALVKAERWGEIETLAASAARVPRG